MSIGGTCGVCGQPGHRYGTTDPEHDFDAVGCVNMLLYRIEQLEAELILLGKPLPTSEGGV